MTKPARKPALQRPAHPADQLPERPVTIPNVAAAEAAGSTAGGTATAGPPAVTEEKYTVQSNMRMKQSTRAALEDAISVLQFKTRDRSHSLQSVVDAAILEYIDNHELRR